MVDDVAVFEIKEDNKHLVLSLTRDNPYSFPETAGDEDATWALVLSLCRSGFGDQLAPLHVRLLHQDLDRRVAYDDFFQCPVRFNAKKFEVIFARADVERPFPAPNREIAKANDKILQRYLDKLQQDDLIGRVKMAIADELPSGTLTDERIAKAVFMSPRSLRRRLSEKDTTYSQLLDTVKRELAEQYLANTAFSLTEITFLLGFSEPSAFSRAFKRWNQQTPSSYRQTLLSNRH